MGNMARAYPPLPPRNDLLAHFRGALANAEDLPDGAQLLADAARFPGALAPAILSLGELSRARLWAVPGRAVAAWPISRQGR